MHYNSSIIELFYLNDFQVNSSPFTMDYSNPQLRPEKHETDIDMAPNLPDFLTLNVSECLRAMQTYTNGLKYFNAEPRLALQCAMELIHQHSMVDLKIQALSIDIMVNPAYDADTAAEATLLSKGLEVLARNLHSKLHLFGIYSGGDYLTYQFYDLNNGMLAMNKITISDPNDYFPSSAPVLPAWVTQRAEDKDQQHFTAPANYF